MTFQALKDAGDKLQAKRAEMGEIFAEAGPDMDLKKVKRISGTTIEIASEIRARNEELTTLAKEYGDLLAVKAAADGIRTASDAETKKYAGGEPGSDSDHDNGRKAESSFGELFVKSGAFTGKQKGAGQGPTAQLDVELKTLMTTVTGWVPEVTRTGRVVPFATRPLQVADLVPNTTTTQAAIQYMEETTFTNAAAEIAEGATYPEAALALTEQNVIVRKIAVFLPITDEQLEDEPQARGYIDNRLPFMVRQRLDSQLLVGNGTAPNIRGFLNVAGIQTQAKGADTTPDAVYKAIIKIEVTGQAIASGVIMHPNDWSDIRLLRTADGIYIWGNPSDSGPERIWGLQVARAQALTENTGLVGDFANFSELAIRRGIDVQISNSHGTFFVEGKQAIRADMRCALVVYRPTAFCTVTGI